MTSSAAPAQVQPQTQGQLGGGSLLEVTALFKEMREEWRAEMKAEQEEKKRERLELEAKLAPQEA